MTDPAYTVGDGDRRTTRRAKQASIRWRPETCGGAPHIPSTRLNQILDEHDFDGYVEGLCQRFYADDGRPGLPPRRYLRLLLIGYFEGLDAERAIAWRAVALRESLGWCCRKRRIIRRFPPNEACPGLGCRHADTRGSGAAGSEAEEERLERRLDPSP